MDLKALIEDVARRKEIDPLLIAAIIDVESGGDPWSVRHEPGYKYLFKPEIHARAIGSTLDTEIVMQSCSFGLMHVMGATAREMGLRGWITQLFDPAIGIEYGCRYLERKAERYKALPDLIASYNAGSVLMRDGDYINREYVTKVLSRMGLAG